MSFDFFTWKASRKAVSLVQVLSFRNQIQRSQRYQLFTYASQGSTVCTLELYWLLTIVSTGCAKRTYPCNFGYSSNNVVFVTAHTSILENIYHWTASKPIVPNKWQQLKLSKPEQFAALQPFGVNTLQHIHPLENNVE
jgi:hypothetical protein